MKVTVIVKKSSIYLIKWAYIERTLHNSFIRLQNFELRSIYTNVIMITNINTVGGI